MSTSESCNVGASNSNNDGVCEVNNKLQCMSTADVSICANCGKEGANNICNKCNITTYCNAVCKKVHKKKHKKDCEEHIRLATEKHDEKLFAEPPSQYGDCPICFLRIPTLVTGSRYYACCGKTICSGCDYAPVYDDQGKKVDFIKQNECPFCRSLPPNTDEESNRRLMKRMEAGDPIAMYNLGNFYRDGIYGLPQDYTKALELWHRAGDLGCADAYGNIATLHYNGRGVERDKEKAIHYLELAAMGGCEKARYDLGIREDEAGNTERELKHHIIAARSGYFRALEKIKEMYKNGHATKEDYTKALQLYQTYLGEVKSAQRDKAAAADEEYRYC